MSEFSELLKATASLLWPILGFVALFLFRNEIANAIGRIRKGKFLGQEVELGDELVRLQKTATEASEEVHLLGYFIDYTNEALLKELRRALGLLPLAIASGTPQFNKKAGNIVSSLPQT